mgnify:FL=1
MYQKIVKKISDNHLYDAIKVAVAGSLPFLFFHETDNFYIAFALSIGAILNAPTDIQSNLKHKINGLILGSICVALITFLLGFTKPYPILFYPVFIFIIFFSAMISIYGHRANLISFVCLLTVSLAFIRDYQGWDLIKNSLLLLAGGMIYLIVSLIFYVFKPKRYIYLEIANCIEQTAEYLDLRASLWNENTNKNKTIEKQLEIQIKLNEYHESIREFLIRNNANSSNSSNNRKLLISLTSLIEILEIATSNSFDHKRIHELFKNDPSLINEYQKLAENFALSLHELSYCIKLNKDYHSPVSLGNQIKAIKLHLDEFQKKQNWSDDKEEIVTFNNVLHYAERQVEKIKGLERVIKGRVNTDELRGKYKDLEKFLTPQHYRFSTLTENLNFSSSIFRHATRLTLTLLIGYILGQILPLQNEYWILMTLVVIMKPDYGLTKSRSFSRVYGTIIGGIIAFTTLYFVDNVTVLLILTFITMIIGNWLTHSDYKIGVIFLTTYVIFMYGILTPNYNSMLLFRIIDTALAAGLALLATHLIWPSWEHLHVKKFMSKSILANRKYVEEIKKYYIQKGEPPLEYKLARKNAFIEVGNLMASFQRMSQEPKSRQKNKAEIYELTVLNQTLISAAASVGIYIQSHQTTEASQAFGIVMDKVLYNLDLADKFIHRNAHYDLISENDLKKFEGSFLQIKKLRREEIENSDLTPEERIRRLEESQLIIDQLIWMINISEQIVNTSKKFKN